MYYIELIFLLLFEQGTCYIEHVCHCFEFTVRNKINNVKIENENIKFKTFSINLSLKYTTLRLAADEIIMQYLS